MLQSLVSRREGVALLDVAGAESLLQPSRTPLGGTMVEGVGHGNKRNISKTAFIHM